MKYKVSTRDSSYLLDTDANTWERIPGVGAGVTRTLHGEIYRLRKPELGERMIFFTDPAPDTPNGAQRVICTSPNSENG